AQKLKPIQLSAHDGFILDDTNLDGCGRLFCIAIDPNDGTLSSVHFRLARGCSTGNSSLWDSSFDGLNHPPSSFEFLDQRLHSLGQLAREILHKITASKRVHDCTKVRF